jgi:uncharacterized protein (DUF1684 family)
MNNRGGLVRKLLVPMAMSAIIGLPIAVSAGDTAISDCAGDYTQCLDDWKAERLAFLRGESGYLNLAGLFWLKEGQNTFGGSLSNDLVFPAITETSLGTFTLDNGRVTMSVNDQYDVWIAGQVVASAVMSDDTTPDPTTARYGSLNWTIIRRDDQFAVRLRDIENPALVSFQPIDYYPADKAYRLKAMLRPYPERRIIRVDTVIAGLDYNPWSPGIVRFELGGESYELEAYDAGDQLFFVFGDKTNGKETYPAGRFLYVRKPGSDGEVTLDFNTAHNPPCAYNDFATCPVASPRNRLPVLIPVGEKYDSAAH